MQMIEAPQASSCFQNVAGWKDIIHPHEWENFPRADGFSTEIPRYIPGCAKSSNVLLFSATFAPFFAPLRFKILPFGSGTGKTA